MASAYTMTPNPADPFSRWMADAFDEKDAAVGVSTGFQSLFGRAEYGGQTLFSPDSNLVDIDIIRANERTAALIPRGKISRSLGSNQKNLNVEKYTAFSRLFPLAEEEGDITGDQILYRMAGENPYQMQTRLNRMRALGGKIHRESVRRIVRLNERLAAQSILTGKMPAILGTTNTDLVYDFQRDSNLVITVANEWNSASGDPLGDIDGACKTIREKGRALPDMMILGTDAMDAFIKDSDVQDVADNRRFELIEVSTGNPVPDHYSRYVEAGFIPRGRLRTPAGFSLWMFTYLDVYDDESGNPKYYMPEDEVVILNSRTRYDRYFGPPELLPLIPQRVQLYSELFGMSPMALPMPPNMRAPGTVIDPAMFYADAYVSGDWKKVTIRTQAAPIFATTHTDAIATLKGLIAEESP